MRVSHAFRPPSLSRLITISLSVLLLSLMLVPFVSANCDVIPAGKSFWVRLLDPLASYSSKPHTPIRAILIQSPECGNTPVFPAGIEVDGLVISARRVGLGFLHDTASLEIRFDRLVTNAGSVLPITSQLVEIDNAREKVRRGVIHGIRATDTPQGRITSRLIHLPTFNPYSDIGLIVYRAFTVLPESEIYLPPGTDLRLQLNEPLFVADQPELPHVSFELDAHERGEIELLLQHSSNRTTTTFGKDADLVNIVFVGSADQLKDAFTSSSWLLADRNSSHAFLKEFGAFLSSSNYSSMPISNQLLNGQPQDSAWQKSLNSYGKREHLRIWNEKDTVLGRQAWLGAYTRETSAVLSLRYHKFIHRIDPNLDEGVNMLVRDLTLSGCVESVHLLTRPDIPRVLTNATGDAMRTEGALTVVHLQPCTRPALRYASEIPPIPAGPRSRMRRYFRDRVLLYKSDVIRGNVVYGAFDLCRMSIRSFQHHRRVTVGDDGLPLTPVSPETLFPQFTEEGLTIQQ